ncbi:hypothetical protein N9263_01355 [Candidatus Marinimicrobia bacterium]|nr:hypothetical protein [Candidatus Neomarinimicrobiota bacterium]
MIRRIIKVTIGLVLVIIGLIGGLIPIFQGWMFGIPGLIILAEYFPPAQRLLNWAKLRTGIK